MNNKLKSVLVVGVLTALSGAASGHYLVREDGPGNWTLSYGPGIFFGAATAVAFFLIYKTHPLKLILWWGASILSWYLALRVFFMSGNLGFGYGSDGSQLNLGYVSAGLTGSLLLTAFFWVLVRRMGLARTGIAILAGGVLGGAMELILSMDETGFASATLIASFMLWQIGVALILAVDLQTKPKTELPASEPHVSDAVSEPTPAPDPTPAPEPTSSPDQTVEKEEGKPSS